MRKKLTLIVFLIVILLTLITLTGCSSNNSTNTSTDNIVQNLEKDIPDGTFSEIGNGTFYLRTISGTSENDNIPVIYVDKDYLAGEKFEMEVDIGISTRDFDATKLSTIYVDGFSQCKEQLGDTDISIYVSANLSTVGIHKVEILQFDEENNVITYKSAQYEIKSK